MCDLEGLALVEGLIIYSVNNPEEPQLIKLKITIWKNLAKKKVSELCLNLNWLDYFQFVELCE